MGQYYKKSKIGTCECMYYLRLEQAQQLAKQGESDDDGIRFEEYLNDGQTKFRFPFPDEDLAFSMKDTPRPDLANYNRGFKIPAGVVKDIEHSTICLSNEHKGGGHNVNIMLPCPHDKKFKDITLAGANLSCGGAGEQYLNIVMEAMRPDGENGELIKRTIFECARCGAMFRMDLEDTKKLKEYLKERYNEPKEGNHYHHDKETAKIMYEQAKSEWDEIMEIIKRIK